MEVVWTQAAQSDLKEVFHYIARDSNFYAQKVVLEILEKAESIATFPKIGRIVPELDQSDIREVFLYSYRIVYRTGARRIEILGVIHGRRDLQSDSLVNRD